MYFYAYVDEKNMDVNMLSKFMKCVEKTATRLNKSTNEVLYELDNKYIGFLYTYERYIENNRVIKVISPEGIRIYVVKESTKSYTVEVVGNNIRHDAESTVKNMRVNATGLRPEEIISGTHNLTKNAYFKLVKGLIPPSKNDLDKVRLFPDLWGVFLTKLSTIEFFSKLDKKDRMSWLRSHEKSGDFDLSEVNNCLFEIIEIGESKINSLTSEQITSILSENVVDLTEVKKLFPFKPGSKGLKGRATLMFYLHLWKISISYYSVTDFEGLVYDMKLGKLQMQSKSNTETIYVFNGLNSMDNEKIQFGIKLEYTEFISPIKKYSDILVELRRCTNDEFKLVENACSGFTAAGYKSLLQKIIRCSPQYVLLDENKSVKAEVALYVVFTLLLQHPGAFVPDIQRFVSGQESAIKRLLVTILEDSSIKEPKDLLKLSVMSFLSQRMVRVWKPSIKEYEYLLDVCRESLYNRDNYKYDMKKDSKLKPHFLSIENSDLENVSALLDEIKSFESDLIMTRSIASNKGLTRKGCANDNTTNDVYPYYYFNNMPISHCVDFHWAPEFVYYLPMDFVNSFKTDDHIMCGSYSSSYPFKRIFNFTWYHLSGLNPRKYKSERSITTDVLKQIEYIEKAQYFALLARKPFDPTIDLSVQKRVSSDMYSLISKLDVSWIAGMVGPIEIAGNPPVMVTLQCNDPYQLIPMRKPARGMKDGTLTDKRYEEAISRAKFILTKNGVPLKSAQTPIPSLSSYRMYLSSDDTESIEYVFEYKNKRIKWGKLANINMAIPYLENKELTFENVLKVSKIEGIQLNGFFNLKKLVKSYDISVIRRTLTYLSSFKGEIEIARISKDGGGTAQSVVLEDVGACQILLYTSLLFPIALQRVNDSTSKFNVILAPLLWEIRDVLKEQLKIAEKNSSVKSKWRKFKDTSGRKLRSYQEDCLKEMVQKHGNNRKGHFLWLTVGLGKTMIALSYLEYLNNITALPNYIIYTLPKSALKSIITEIEFFGLPINLLLPVGGWKKHPEAKYIINNKEILPFHINIIEHDHLRLLVDEINMKASQSLVIFDEVHKALNDTKRTSVALELSRLSVDFIAMTGTPIIDSNTYKLIWWLEQIVDFEVNEKNFWVAANNMIAKKINTGIDIDRQDVEVQMPDEIYKNYAQYVPPTLGGTNSHPSHSDIIKAFNMCYDVCDVKIINLTLSFLGQNKGVMIVARNAIHQDKLMGLLVENNVKEKDIYLLKGNDSIYLTDENVKKRDVPNYKVVITSLRKSEGYTLSKLSVMITGVYPSNNAVREQLEGRINRVNQKAPLIYYRIVHTGILTYVMQRHKDATSLNAVLSAIAEEVTM